MGNEDAEETAPPKLLVKVHRSDLATDLSNAAVEICTEGVRRHASSFRDGAAYIKKEMDKKCLDPPSSSSSNGADGVWHAIAGSSFAASVSHETRAFIHVQVGTTHCIVFKSKDSPFDTQ